MRKPLRVLVCGGRDFNRHVVVYDALTELQDERGPIDVIIAGRHPGEEPNGADYWAESWSFMQRVPFYGFPARWGDISHPDALVRRRSDGTLYDAKAGPRRNQRMIDEGCPTIVVALPGGRGTADMVRRARAAGIEVREISALAPNSTEGRSDRA
jgi:hypothetical protein